MNIWIKVQDKQSCLCNAIEIQGLISGLYLAEDRCATIKEAKNLACELVKRTIDRDGDQLGFILSGVGIRLWLAKL